MCFPFRKPSSSEPEDEINTVRTFRSRAARSFDRLIQSGIAEDCKATTMIGCGQRIKLNKIDTVAVIDNNF